MKPLFLFISLFFLVHLTYAQQNKIKVYLLGTFHFNQTDTTVYDVRSAKNQKSIEKLSAIIVGLKPDKIFIERMPEWEHENHMDSLYQAYKNGHLRRARNEIWQVAGRTANKLGHNHLYQCDQPGNYNLYFGQIEEYATAHNQTQKLAYIGKGITAPLTSTINCDSLRNQNDLLEYLRWLNSKAVQESSHAHYINVYPQIGNTDVFHYDSTYFLGTNLTVDWYRRNILIYAKMIAQLDYDEKAIFLIIGNDHIPIIRQMFKANPYFVVIDNEKWLGKSKIAIR